MIHNFLKGSIVLFEFFALLFQLLLNVLIPDENSFQILPFFLYLHPYFNAFRNQVQGSFPVSNSRRKSASILTGCDCLQIGELVVEQQFFLIYVGQNPSPVVITLFILRQIEVLLFPNLVNFVQLFFILKFLDCFIYNLFNFFLVALKLHFKHLG